MDLDRAVLAAATARGDLDVRGDTDAEQRAIAACAAGGLLAAQVVVAGVAGGGVGGVDAATLKSDGSQLFVRRGKSSQTTTLHLFLHLHVK
jgi:hypothetical protein